MTREHVEKREELRLILHRGLDQLSLRHPLEVKQWLELHMEHWAMTTAPVEEEPADTPATTAA